MAIREPNRMSPPISSQTRGKLGSRAAQSGHHQDRTLSSSSSSSSSAKQSSSPLLSGRSTTNYRFNYTRLYSSKLAFLALVTFTSILLLTCLVNQRVSALNCYSCSSADNPGCDEAFSGRPNITDTDCETKIGRPAKVCRKIVQYMENKKVVIRSCGWIDEHEKDKKPMCYKRSGTFALMMESCICYEDNCNHSTSLVPNQSVSILLASGSMIFYYLFSTQRDRLH